MRILHVSDTHGPIPWKDLPDDFDVLVHSGDWMPDRHSMDRDYVIQYQMDFLRHEAACVAAWLKDRPLVFCAGNHDRLSEAYMERELREHGVNAYAPGHHGAKVLGVRFFGLREIPCDEGHFEGEYPPRQLSIVTTITCGFIWRDDILVAHCPPEGPLAGDSVHKWGNVELADILHEDADDSPEYQWAPQLILCGHIHACGGSEYRVGRSRIINSAQTFTLVEAKVQTNDD